VSFPDLDPLEYDRWYDTKGRTYYELELSLIAELIPEFQRGLEVGVGTGRFAHVLGIQFGLDPKVSMLEVAKERGILCTAGVCESLPFADSSFDLVLLAFTLCFLDDPLRCFKEIERCLVSGGRVLVGFIPKGSSLWEEYSDLGKRGHRIYREAVFYSIEEVKRMLEEAELTPVAEGGMTLGEPEDEIPDFAVILAQKAG